MGLEGAERPAEPQAAPSPAADPVPIVRGAHGLTGRAPVVRDFDYEPPHDEQPPEPQGFALPSGCMRNLQLGHMARQVEDRCPIDCHGKQEDGSCLAELIQQLPEGTDWACDVRMDQWGNYFWRLNVEEAS